MQKKEGPQPLDPYFVYDSHHRNTELVEALIAGAKADSV